MTRSELIDRMGDAIVEASACKCGKPQPLSACEAEAALEVVLAMPSPVT